MLLFCAIDELMPPANPNSSAPEMFAAVTMPLPTSDMLFKENVRFILRSELMVGRAHDGGRTARAERLLVLTGVLLTSMLTPILLL